MASKTPAAKPHRPLSERQKAALGIAEAMVSNIGYELLDSGDGEVAANLAKRAVQIADAVIERGAA